MWTGKSQPAIIIYVKTMKKLFYSSRKASKLERSSEIREQELKVEQLPIGRGGNCEPASPISLHTVP